MSEATRILNVSDLELILQIERAKIGDPFEEWHAPWRRESLEHYLPQGWSFGYFAAPEFTSLEGYVLAQPLLFYRGLTQTLWVEHLSAASPQVAGELVSLICRWGRDKHLQMLSLPSTIEVSHLGQLSHKKSNLERIEVATSRMI